MKKLFIWLTIVSILYSAPLVAKTKKATKPVATEQPASVSEPAPAAEEGQVLNSFSRTINFDPHPTLIEPLPSPLALEGKKVSYTVEFLETWDTKGKAPNLKELGFKVVMSVNDKEVKTFDFPKKALDQKSLKKGLVLAGDSFETLGISIVVDDSTKEGKAVTGVSITGKLLGRGEAKVEAPTLASGTEPTTEPAPIVTAAGTAPTVTAVPAAPAMAASLGLARQLAKKGDDMAEAHAAAKIALYKKALTMLGENLTAPDALSLSTELKEKIGKLESQATAKPAAPGAPTQVPGIGKPTPEVQALYDEAMKKFNLSQEAEGRDFLRKAVEKDPTFHAAWFQLAKNALSNNKYAKAKEAAEKALGLRDDDVEAGVILFKSCYYLGETEVGIEKLSGMAKRYPKKFEAQYALADAYYQAGDLPACEEQCVKMTDAFKGNDRVRDLLAKTREKMK